MLSLYNSYILLPLYYQIVTLLTVTVRASNSVKNIFYTTRQKNNLNIAYSTQIYSLKALINFSLLSIRYKEDIKPNL